MEPHEYFTTWRKYAGLVVGAGIVAGGMGVAYAATLPELYRSTSSVFVASQRGATTLELVQGSTFTQDQVQSYAQLAPTPAVLDPVIDKLGLETTAQALAGSVSADIRLNTVIIDVTVTNSSPEDAATIADAVTDSLASVAETLAPLGPDNVPAITMTTVSGARVPSAPFSPNRSFIVLTAVIVGAGLAAAFAFARELLDTRVRTDADVRRVTPAPILTSTARRRRQDLGSLVMRSAPHSTAAEDFRRLATNLEFADVDNPVRTVVVTSALESEGKTTNAINLALAMAERLERVLLIDGDLRRPSVAAYCGLDGTVGLTTVLIGGATLDEAITPWAGGFIDVLAAGAIPANPTQLLGSNAMVTVLESLVDRYDFIVIDSAPLIPVTDSLTLAKLADGAIVVIKSRSTTRGQVTRALESLRVVNAPVLGVVLQGIRPSRETAYYTEDAAGDPAAQRRRPAASGGTRAGGSERPDTPESLDTPEIFDSPESSDAPENAAEHDASVNTALPSPVPSSAHVNRDPSRTGIPSGRSGASVRGTPRS